MFRTLVIIVLMAYSANSSLLDSLKHGKAHRADVTTKHPATTEQSHSHKNIWGFTDDCTVICKSVEHCIGKVPKLKSVCKHSKFNHHCCQRIKRSSKHDNTSKVHETAKSNVAIQTKSVSIPTIESAEPLEVQMINPTMATPRSTTAVEVSPSSTAETVTGKTSTLFATTESHCEFKCSTRSCQPKDPNNLAKCSGRSCHVDKCMCRSCDPSFVAVDNSCEPLNDVCSKIIFTGMECAVKDQYYAYLGVVCKSRVNLTRNCDVENTMLAVKFLEETTFDDDEITYLPVDEVPHETTEKCTSFKAKVWKDGNYGLSVDVADYSEQRDSTITVRLNNLPVMSEVSFASFMDPELTETEIFLDFKVVGGKLDVRGFPLVDILDGHINVSICSGDCSKPVSTGIQSTSFAVIKLARKKKEPCTGQTDRACSARKHGCQYSPVYKESVQLSNCPVQPGCFYNNSFYLDGGVLCRYVGPTSQDCKLDTVLMAVNLEGPDFGPDSRGVTYKSGASLKPNVTNELVYKPAHTTEVAHGVSEADSGLYLNYLRGHSLSAHHKVNRNDCISWSTDIDRDGAYEMSLKTGEFYYTFGIGRRTFNVKINGEVVLQEVDLLALAPKRTGIDIVLHFEVTDDGSLLHMRGYPIRKFDGKFVVQICYGECLNEDKNWAVAALYVARFNHTNKILNAL